MATPAPRAAAQQSTLLAADRARFDAWMLGRFGHHARLRWLVPSWACVRLHRAAHAAWSGGARWRGRLLTQVNGVLTGADIHPHCRFGPGLLVVHPVALTASGQAGSGFTMQPLSGIGMLPRADDVGAGPGLPLLGDGVWLGAGCGVLGPVRVGDGARVGPGAALTRSVAVGAWVRRPAAAQDVSPPGAPAAGSPAHMPARMPALEAADTLPAAPVVEPCSGHRWSDTRALLRADVDRYLAERLPGVACTAHPWRRRLGAGLSNEVLTVSLHRLAHQLHAWRLDRAARALAAVNLALFGATLDPRSCIGGGWFLPHPAGAVVQGHAGRRLTMFARSAVLPGSTAGAGRGSGDRAAWPRLGDDAVIAGMAAVVGPATVGEGARVGFNMHVGGSVPARRSVAGPAMRTQAGVAAAACGLPRADALRPASAAVSAGPAPRAAGAWALWRADCERLADDGAPAPLAALLCAALHRGAHAQWQRGRRRAARRLWQANVWLTGADIDPRSRIGGGLRLRHPAGVSLHLHAGERLSVGPLVVAGPACSADPDGVGAAPVLGDDVTLALHATVCGPFRLGAGVHVGAGCSVDGDVADGAWLAMVPPRLHARPPVPPAGAGSPSADDEAA